MLGPHGVSPTGAKALAGSEGSAKADNKARPHRSCLLLPQHKMELLATALVWAGI